MSNAVFGGIIFGIFALPLICIITFELLKSIHFILFVDIPLIIESETLRRKLENGKEKEVVPKWIQLMTL